MTEIIAEQKEAPVEPHFYVKHNQVFSSLFKEYIDENIVYFLEYLKQEEIITLHSCEGDPIDFHTKSLFSLNSKDPEYDGKGYIHFYNAEHLGKALIACHTLALSNNDLVLASNIMQEQEVLFGSNDNIFFNYFNWDYEIGWTTVHPWNEHERCHPYQGRSLTAIVRVPHEHLLSLNEYCKNVLLSRQ